jgi:hypothetical protein
MGITVTPLLPTTANPRDPGWTTQDEATKVAQSMINQSDGPSDINIYEQATFEGSPNQYPDGRKAWYLKFTLSQDVTMPSTGRVLNQSIPYDVNAGQNLDYLKNKPTLPWKFIPISIGDDTFTGDTEK